MKLNEALSILKKTCNIKFSKLFNDLPSDLIINKGNVGQLLLKYIGLRLDSNLRDFDDGELKTNKSDQYGFPLETMFITQISKNFDDFLSDKCFATTNVYLKISNLVYLSVCKENKNSDEWFFVNCYHVNLDTDKKLYLKLKDDYNSIKNQINRHLQTNDKQIHTSSGNFLQIRSKDSKPYHPIFSSSLDRYVSNKNHAFYFKKEFMRYVIKNYKPVNEYD